MKTRKLILTTLLIAAICLAAVCVQAATLAVDGQSNIFGAGHAVAPNPGGGGAGILPPSYTLPSGTGRILTFSSITGIVSCGPGSNGADGGPYASGNTDILSYGGISGIINNDATMFLVGVFLNDDEPIDPAPARLDFTGNMNLNIISPELAQAFFIGDGLTGTGSGAIQQFEVPTGATRLFLGFEDAYEFGDPTSDAGWYHDNWGSLDTEFNVTAVPEPSTLLTIGLPVLTLGLSRLRRQRK
jgi:hypothetical protein